MLIFRNKHALTSLLQQSLLSYLLLLLPFVAPLNASAEVLDNVIALVRSGDRSPDDTGDIKSVFNPFTQNGESVVFGATVIEKEVSQGGGIFLVNKDGSGLRLIARDGQLSPDGDGIIAQALGSEYSINNHDDVVFFTYAMQGTPNTQGIYFWDDSTQTLSAIARTGQTVPGGEDTFTSFGTSGFSPTLNDSGQIGIGADGSAPSFGIYRYDPASSMLTRVIRTGDVLKDGVVGVVGNSLFSMNRHGEISFGAVGDFLSTLYLGNGMTNTKIIRRNEPVPNGDGFFNITGVPFDVRVNDMGEVAFYSGLWGTTGGASANVGIFRGNGSSTVEIIREGDPAPDANGTVSTLDIYFSLNNRGRVVFHSSIDNASDGADSGIFIGNGATLVQVAREGEPAPGGGFLADMQSSYAINDLGHVVLEASIDFQDGGNTKDSRGIFYFDGHALNSIARIGDEIPDEGVITQIEFHVPLMMAIEPERNVINNRLQVVFTCEIDGESALALWSDQILDGGFEQTPDE